MNVDVLNHLPQRSRWGICRVPETILSPANLLAHYVSVLLVGLSLLWLFGLMKSFGRRTKHLSIKSCTGALAKHCTSVYPECSVTIFDLPKVVRIARERFVNEGEDRISFLEGDFFKDDLPAADLYIVCRVLHDWTDERCIELLRGIYKACKPGGGVLVVEMLINEDGSGPLTAHLHSLIMLLQTEGKERSGSHHVALLTAAGFTDIQYRYTGKLYDAVLGHKEK